MESGSPPSPGPVDESAEHKSEIVAEETSLLDLLVALSSIDVDSKPVCTSSLASSNGEAVEATINEGNGSENSTTNSGERKNYAPEHPALEKLESVLDEDEGYFDEKLRNENETAKAPEQICATPPDPLSSTSAKASKAKASKASKAKTVGLTTRETPSKVCLEKSEQRTGRVPSTRKRQSGICNEFSIPASVISKIRESWKVDEQQAQNRLEESLKLEYFRSMFADADADQAEHTAEAMLQTESLRKAKGIQRSTQLDRKLSKTTLRLKGSSHGLNEFRQKLPALALRSEILDKIKQSQVLLVKGETGSGKTTQIPQYILEEASSRGEGSSCRIICTQPRRISAISLAKRVAKERGEPMGQSIGYQVRLDSVKPRKQGGSILFCTTGVVLAFMQSDPLLREYSHLVLDEIHERDVITDLLLAIIRMVLPYRKDLRVILMSATLTAETFSAYFNNCPVVEIRGVTFPVREYYLEDVLKELNWHTFDVANIQPAVAEEYIHMISRYLPEIQHKYPKHVLKALRLPASEYKQYTLLVALLYHISCSQPDGAILVFLPTVDQISRIHQMIHEHPLLSEIDMVVHMLHSKLSSKEQQQVFVQPPLGTRKIILATNIAETSITIDDVVYVVNTGRHMINVMIGNTCGLLDQWISKSNEVQRKGRAGRVQPGTCYHLYSRGRKRTFTENVPPEILRIVLDEVILHIKVLRLGEARTFMARLLDKPSEEVIENSLRLLTRMKAIDHDQRLTPLGFQLAQLGMHPTVGKMILLASILGCIDPITSIAATLSFKDPFIKSLNRNEEEKEIQTRKWFAGNTASDHIMLANVIARWRTHRNPASFCKHNALNREILKQLVEDKNHICQHLCQRRIVTSDDCQAPANNVNATNMDLLNGIIAGGLCTNIVNLTRTSGAAYRWCMDGKQVRVDSMSVNGVQSFVHSRYMVYQNMLVLRNSPIISVTTIVSPLSLFFFGANVHGKKKSGKIEITIGGQFGFNCNLETYRLIEDLRQAFDGLLTRKLTIPSPIDWSSADGALLRAIVELLTCNFDTNETKPKNS